MEPYGQCWADVEVPRLWMGEPSRVIQSCNQPTWDQLVLCPDHRREIVGEDGDG